MKERRREPIYRCPNDVKNKISYAATQLLLKRIMFQAKGNQKKLESIYQGNQNEYIEEIESGCWSDRFIRFFITTLIIGSVINAIWLIFGCVIKIKPMSRSEGYGIEMTITEKQQFDRKLNNVIYESYIKDIERIRNEKNRNSF